MIKDALFGLAVGDALGVPVEFKSRESIRQNPVVDMEGYGTYNLPAGTWSDDSSLTFCLAEALTDTFEITRVADNFKNWLYKDYWTPYGVVFDVGNTTREAISRLVRGVQPEAAGGVRESENGNGSLMRILPLVYLIRNKPIGERFRLTRQVSSITHGHIRSVIACFYYLEFARQLLLENNKFSIYKYLQTSVPKFLESLPVDPAELAPFKRLFQGTIQDVDEREIRSSGYVIDTLEASIWCLLTTGTYRESVLKAVNLGSDTDTTGAVTGGLAGLLYGFNEIPRSWVDQLARKDDIADLANRLGHRLDKKA